MSLLDLIGLQRIYHNGAEVFRRKKLNFLGGTVTDNPANDSTDIALGEGEGGGSVVGPEVTVPGHLATWANEDGTELDDSGQALSGLATNASVAAALAAALEGRDLGNDGAKLDTIEAGAQVTSEARVRAALAVATADIAVNSRKITALADPASPQDADTKAARDAAITAALGGAAAWSTLLDLNLTTESAFTFVNGNNSWKGLTWVGQDIASCADQFAIVPGTGLVIDHNAANTANHLVANVAPRIYLPLSSIPGFRLGRSSVRMTWQVAIAGADANYELAEAGFDNLPFVANQKFQHFVTRGYDGGSKSQNRTLWGNSDTRVDNPSQAHDVFEIALNPSFHVARASKISTRPASDPNSAEFSGLTLRSLWVPSSVGNINPATAFYLPNAEASLVLILSCESGNTSNTLVVTYKRLRIEYLL